MNYHDLAARLVGRGRRLGASEVEVYLQTSRNLSIRVRNGDVETIQQSETGGVGFRVIVNGSMGFSHCNDFSDKSLTDTLRRAVAFAKLTTPEDHNILPDDKQHDEAEGLYDPSIVRVPMDKKIDMALELESLALKDDRITHSSGASFGEGESEIIIANSRGMLKSYKASACSLSVSVVAEKNGQRHTGWEFSSRRHFDDLEPLPVIAESAAKKAWEMLDPRMVPTQRASVIFDPAVARSLVGGIIAAINGERVLQGASFLKDSMDEQFASALLTIVDDGLRPKGLGSKPFDGEGVAVSKRVLVENGVLRSFLHNTQSARRAGTESTGNASRGGFTSLPGIGTHNLYIASGDLTPESIIANTRKGILLKGVTGYGINPVNGNYSGGASGFWIENGRITHPVQGLTIAGSAGDILNNIDMMANDLDLNRSFAAPTFRVREMQIGGA
ncbi:MAG: TldD/PmbA family protein [Bacteroidales bacterium]|nr:TldD/PmbA family protein [Bacteroidales bacterium]